MVDGAAVTHRSALACRPDAVIVEIEAAMLADGTLELLPRLLSVFFSGANAGPATAQAKQF
jgi:hypothetical protein